MLSILSKIFGSGEVISKGLDLIDDAWETDAETRKSKTDAKISLMKAYAPFKIAQRYLAVMFTVNFLILFWLAIVLKFMGRDLSDLKELMDMFYFGEIQLAIVVFYFGGGMVESYGRRNKVNEN
jgi:hypothetical protein